MTVTPVGDWFGRTMAGIAMAARDPAFGWSVLAGAAFGVAFATLLIWVGDMRTMGAVRGGVFQALLMACGLMAWRRGGQPERMVMLILLLSIPGALLIWAVRPPSFGDFETGIFALDGLMLIAMLVVMCRANRYWPIVVAGFQGCILAAHLTRMADPGMHPVIYGLFEVFWTYAMLPVLAVGTWRHAMRVRAAGGDRDWS